MNPSFVHLRIHTEFSLVDGIVRIKPLVKKLGEYQMPAAAITEQSNLFSLVKFYKAAQAPASSRLPEPTFGFTTRKSPPRRIA